MCFTSVLTSSLSSLPTPTPLSFSLSKSFSLLYLFLPLPLPLSSRGIARIEILVMQLVAKRGRKILGHIHIWQNHTINKLADNHGVCFDHLSWRNADLCYNHEHFKSSIPYFHTRLYFFIWNVSCFATSKILYETVASVASIYSFCLLSFFTLLSYRCQQQVRCGGHALIKGMPIKYYKALPPGLALEIPNEKTITFCIPG